nr:MAG TPA: hypothetical protein [Caudoviricetes sp.]
MLGYGGRGSASAILTLAKRESQGWSLWAESANNMG